MLTFTFTTSSRQVTTTYELKAGNTVSVIESNASLSDNDFNEYITAFKAFCESTHPRS